MDVNLSIYVLIRVRIFIKIIKTSTSVKTPNLFLKVEAKLAKVNWDFTK